MKTFYTSLVFLTLVLFTTEIIYPQWVQTNGPGSGNVFSLVVCGNNIIAGSNVGIYISNNNGASWKHLINGPSGVRSLAINGSTIVAGSYFSGIYISTDNGDNWSSAGLTNYGIPSIAIDGTNIFAGTDTSGVYLSTDNGINWTQANNGLTNKYVNSLVISGDNIFVGTEGGVYLSTNNGTLWTQVNNGLGYNIFVLSIVISGTNIFAGTYNGLFLSTNNGTLWTEIDKGLDPMISSLAISGDTIFAGINWPDNGGVYRSTDKGANWKQVGLDGRLVYSLAIIGTNIYAGASVFGGPNAIQGIFLSTDNGTNWAQEGLPTTIVPAFFIKGDSIYASANGSVFLSSDNGTNWKDLNLTYSYQTDGINAIIEEGTNIYAGTGRGLFVSSDNGINWANIYPGVRFVYALIKDGTNIFVGGTGGVYITSDNGLNWVQRNAGLPNSDIRCLVISGVNIYAGTKGDGVFLSTNNGSNWTQANNGLTNTNVNALINNGDNIFAGTNGGVFHSTNNGASWTQVNNALIDTTVNALTVSGNYISAGTNSGVFLSTNNGINWTNVGMDNMIVLSVAINETNIFAGSNGEAVWRRALSDFALPVEMTSFTVSAGKGSVLLKWSTATELNNMGFDVERSINKSEWGKVGFVKGSGNSTSSINYSYVDKSVSQEGKYFYRLKQIDNNGTFKYSSVAEVEFATPTSFALNQNYPNPFNPSTKISYTLKDKGFVKLRVYGIKGELVKVLVNESKDAGYYESEFDGKGLASGVYIYRLEVIGDGNKVVYSDIKKTVLLK